MKYVFDLHNVMQEKKILLTYAGEFTQEITKAVLAMTERNLESINEESSTKRKIFKVMVESLQNIVKHAEESDMKPEYKNAIFAINRKEDSYEIITGNYMFNQKISTVTEKISQVNTLDPDGLKKLYKEVIRNGKISEKGGAGLGFIDMARKSGQKLDFSFHQVDNEYSFFVLITKILRK